MAKAKREHRERTDNWKQIQQWCRWPEQRLYESIRPVVLFGETPAEREGETSPSVYSSSTRPLSRAQRSHWRLSWTEHLACNVVTSTSPSVSITLFGIPDAFATQLVLETAIG